MKLEDIYKSSKANLKPSIYSGQSAQLVDHSKLNIDAVPSKYNLAGKIVKIKDPSKLNIDRIPTKYKG
jgi:hypothetical protein